MAGIDDDIDLMSLSSALDVTTKDPPAAAVSPPTKHGIQGEFDGEGAGEHEVDARKKSDAAEAQRKRFSSGAGRGDAEEAGEDDFEWMMDDEEEEEEEHVVRPRVPARPGVCARFAVSSYNPENDVFLMVRRKKTTIFIDAKEDTTVLELKRMIAGITKVLPEDQKLFNNNQQELDDKKKISDYGLNTGTAKPQLPATIALVFKDDNGEWEAIDIAPLSQPPELPEVMRQQEPIGIGADAA